MSPLSTYKSKRNLEKTPEPKARKKKSQKALIFVIQKHHARSLHYDFRLELDGVLKSWAVPKGMPTGSEKRLAMMTEDHPYDYKNFQGVIPRGNYGAGLVEIWDHGTYTIAEAATLEETEAYIPSGLKKGHIRFELIGERCVGQFHLVHTKREDAENAWLLFKASDHKEAKSKAAMPKQVKPMLAQLVDEPFDAKNWLFEIKWDGFRAMAYIRNGKVRLLSRNDESFNKTFPSIVAVLTDHKLKDCILDGEIVALDEEGHAQFQAMQNIKKIPAKRLYYYVFDLIYSDGEDLRNLPLLQRKERLEILLAPLKNTTVRYNDHVLEQGTSLFKEAQKLQIEGIIAKNAQSTYQERRSKDWQKIKVKQFQEAVICGFTASTAGDSYFGALLLGTYLGEELCYIGKVGTGFNEKAKADLAAKFKALTRKSSPFSVPLKKANQVTFLKPVLMCEISFTEWTDDGLMRHPVFLGLSKKETPKKHGFKKK